MASPAPAKSHPLHNFSLPHLKWNKDAQATGNHQRRRSTKSPSRRPSTSSASPLRHSPLRDSVSATPPRLQSPLSDSSAPPSPPPPPPRESPIRSEYSAKQSPARVESSRSGREWPARGDPVRHRRDESSRNLTMTMHTVKDEPYSFEPKSKAASEVDLARVKRSKILIKIPVKNNKPEDENPQLDPVKIETNNNKDEDDDKASNIDEETKTWNLRPRKPFRKSLNVNGSSVKINGSAMPENTRAQSPLMNPNNRSGENEGNLGEKKEKRKLSISIALTKEEIEDDVFALTGSKPARRPKKRAKNIQKQVDFVFPGLWLVGINADSYKVSENSMKV